MLAKARQLVVIFVTGASAALALAACSVNTLPEIRAGQGPLRIVNDTGGNPYEYAALYRELLASGRAVKLGECNSACTMLMSLPNACLLRGKRFGFHASNFGGRFNGVVAQHYTPRIREAFERDWGRSRVMRKFTAEELVAIDPALKLCRA